VFHMEEVLPSMNAADENYQSTTNDANPSAVTWWNMAAAVGRLAILHAARNYISERIIRHAAATDFHNIGA